MGNGERRGAPAAREACGRNGRRREPPPDAHGASRARAPRKWGRAGLRNAAFCRQIGYDGIPKAAAAADEGVKKQGFFGKYSRPFRRLPH